MPRYKITIEYDGTGFVGWQKQDNGISIQEVVTNAIKSFSQQDITLQAAGRTDAGVHALGQVAHFDLDDEISSFEAYKIRDAANHFLKNHNISITRCDIASEDFHARFSAKMRHYRYIILNRAAKPAIDYNKLHWVPSKLDYLKMDKAAKLFIGKHDFTAFRASHCQSKSPIKSLSQFNVKRDREKIIFEVSAISFLHNQVRSMVGSLLEIGKGKYEIDNISNILQSKDRSKCGPVAPACGLYLTKVDY